MKSLYKYITESNESPQYLLLTLEDAKQFFEEHKIFEKKSIHIVSQLINAWNYQYNQY